MKLIAEHPPLKTVMPLPLQIVVVAVLLVLSGVFAGLILGLMSLDVFSLQLISKCGGCLERLLLLKCAIDGSCNCRIKIWTKVCRNYSSNTQKWQLLIVLVGIWQCHRQQRHFDIIRRFDFWMAGSYFIYCCNCYLWRDTPTVDMRQVSCRSLFVVYRVVLLE